MGAGLMGWGEPQGTMGVEAAHAEERATDGRLVIAGCYANLQNTSGGETWYTFSKDGGFSEDRKFISITGFSKPPVRDHCYEMVVAYETDERYCYYTSNPLVPRPNIPGHCSGWRQLTREFYLEPLTKWVANP